MFSQNVCDMGQSNKKGDVNKNIDVSRSQHQQAQENAGTDRNIDEQRPEGAKYKGNPKHRHGSHEEGEYTRQSDNPTMHPSNLDDE